MPGMAAKVVITERQQEVLQTMVWSRSCSQGLAHRAEIILLAFAGCLNEVIAERLNCERHGVGIWRRRWQQAFSRLVVIECVEKPAALRQAIEEVLGDLPRAVVAARSPPSRSPRSWRWPVSRPRTPADQSRTGPRGNWPTR